MQSTNTVTQKHEKEKTGEWKRKVVRKEKHKTIKSDKELKERNQRGQLEKNQREPNDGH